MRVCVFDGPGPASTTSRGIGNAVPLFERDSHLLRCTTNSLIQQSRSAAVQGSPSVGTGGGVQEIGTETGPA